MLSWDACYTGLHRDTGYYRTWPSIVEGTTELLGGGVGWGHYQPVLEQSTSLTTSSAGGVARLLN